MKININDRNNNEIPWKNVYRGDEEELTYNLQHLNHDLKYNDYQTIPKNTYMIETFRTNDPSDKWNYYLTEITNPDNAITSFNYSRGLNLVPLYAIPKGTSSDWSAETAASYANEDPIQIDTQYPIETDISFTIIAEDYQARQMKDKFKGASKTDVVIDIKDGQDGSMINSFTGKNVRLIGETTNASVEGELQISLSYKGYETLHNPVS